MRNENLISKLKNKIIVSCQSGKDEPTYSPEFILLTTKAVIEGGASAIRAENPTSIRQIKHFFNIPVIGLYKKYYDDSEVYITPTKKEIDAIVRAGSDIIALDATNRNRPNNKNLSSLIEYIKNKYYLPIMADISTYEEGLNAEKLGFDLISTTLSGYTSYSKISELPDFELLDKLVNNVSTPVILEGKVWNLSDIEKAFKIGAYSVVIGSSITRPHLITRRFCSKIFKFNN